MQPISAVIPNRDGADLLRLILPPLLEQLPPPGHEILVVDDASEDDSRDMLAGEFPSVRVVALETNLGFGAACNRGFGEARHDMVLLLNSDMIVTPGSLQLLLEHFDAPDIFAAGPIYLGEGEDPANLGRRGGATRHQIGTPAGGGLFRRSMFLELGGFDPLYHPFYWEDLDLGWNAWRSGKRIVYDTRCPFVHMENRTIKRLYSAAYVKRIRARNRVLFGVKNLRHPSLLGQFLGRCLLRAGGGLVKRRDASSLVGVFMAGVRLSAALRQRHTCHPGLDDLSILERSHTPFGALLGV